MNSDREKEPPAQQTSPVDSRWVTVDGLRIHALVAGEAGSPVVLLHGAGVDSARLSWEETIGPLAREHRVYAPDLPGYGQSDKPDVIYNAAFYTTFLAHLLDAWQLPKVSLVGLSMGGAIALSFTLAHPERVARLVPVDPYGIMPKVAWHRTSYLYVHSPLNELSYWFFRQSRSMVRWSLLASLISNPERVTDQLVDDVFAASRAPQAGKAFSSFQRHDLTWNGLRTNYLDRLHEIAAPTLFVHGEKDPGVPVAYARQAHAQVKGSQLHVMQGCLHWPMRDRPGEFNRVLVEFLRDS
ncbi:MAG: alpha/beta fold hydrolase [Anaerolineales bacterium]|nr:alpha/beta fold hydrolase [Anaerolineales bacterium]